MIIKPGDLLKCIKPLEICDTTDDTYFYLGQGCTFLVIDNHGEFRITINDIDLLGFNCNYDRVIFDGLTVLYRNKLYEIFGLHDTCEGIGWNVKIIYRDGSQYEDRTE